MEAGQHARFQHNTALTKQTSQIKIIIGYSQDILPELSKESYNLIYIDGSHRAANVLLDAFLSWPRLKPGGILIFDDYLKCDQLRVSLTPKLAIDLFLENKVREYEVLHFGYQVALRKSGSFE